MSHKNDFTTHLPILVSSAIFVYQNAPSRPMYELGVGYYSTPVLHSIALSYNSTLLSYDDNNRWMKKFEYLSSENHFFSLVKKWDDFKLDGPCSLLFIDNSLLPNERLKLANSFCNDSSLIVVHDSDKFTSLDLEKFKYKFSYEHLVPYTIVLSNFFDVKSIFGRIFNSKDHFGSF